MNGLAWLAMAPWLSIPEWAGFMCVDRSTVSRRVAGWREDGLVVCRNEGRSLRPRDRFILTTGGLDKLFPDRHTHPGWPGHTHDALDDFLAHGHPSYFNGYAGILNIRGQWSAKSVIPAKAGIYALGCWKGRICRRLWIPAFAGMTGEA